MPVLTSDSRPLNIMLVIMGQSPYNRSIWAGLLGGFESLGHSVEVVDATQIPAPGSFGNKPDLLFAVHGGNVPLGKIQAYREHGVPTAVYLLDEPYEVDHSVKWSRHYDCVFSVDRATVPVHGKCTRAEYLPLAYDHTIFKPDGPMAPSRILVLGTPFEAREQYLTAVRDSWGELVTWVGPGWRDFSTAGQHYEGYADPDACARFYRGADIVINIHRDSFWSHFGDLNKERIEATHLNPRFWETSGCGSFQLCSYRSDLDKFSIPGITFSSVEEFTRKTEYFLNNDKARRENALRLHKKIRRHTYLERSKALLGMLSP